jgi:RNase P/RNase MRP subunit p30
MAELLRVAGYSVVALALPTGLLQERVAALRRLFEGEGIRTVLRVDLSANSRAELLRLLRRFRARYDVLAVKCVNQVVASVACRDRRVDLIFFDPANARVKFGHQFASMLRGAVELNVVSTFLGETRKEIFSRVAKEVAVATEHGSKVVLSSGCSSPATVRSPVQISAIAASIGLSTEQCSLGVSELPLSIIHRNRERRSPLFVEEGVNLVPQKQR